MTIYVGKVKIRANMKYGGCSDKAINMDDGYAEQNTDINVPK